MSETEKPPTPEPPPVVLRFRVVKLETGIVLLGPAPRPDRHVLVLGLSRAAALGLAQACLGIATQLGDEARTLIPLVLPGELIDERTALGIIAAKSAARKAARKEAGG